MTLQGIEVVFATETGTEASADQNLVKPSGFVLSKLAAENEAKEFYKELQEYPQFKKPITWASINPSDYHGLMLCGGHAPGMKQYLESKLLQQQILAFWKLRRPVAAICHGVLLLARVLDETGRSVLYEKKTTTLPSYMENFAYYLTKWQYGALYHTYEVTCEEEVSSFLSSTALFQNGPYTIVRGSAYDNSAAFVVEDENYISARWPGDSFLFAKKFIEKLLGKSSVKPEAKLAINTKPSLAFADRKSEQTNGSGKDSPILVATDIPDSSILQEEPEPQELKEEIVL